MCLCVLSVLIRVMSFAVVTLAADESAICPPPPPVCKHQDTHMPEVALICLSAESILFLGIEKAKMNTF